MRASLPSLLAPLALVAAPIAGGGCFHFHLERNAPGVVDVAEAPPVGHDLPPGDPGERMLALNPGLLGGLGANVDGDARFLATSSVEVSLVGGHSENSHHEDDVAVYPLEGDGVTFGWTAVRHAAGATSTGPLYLLLQTCRIQPCVGAGYAFDPRRHDHGPQADAFFGPLYVRARYLIDGGADIELGIQLKLSFVWVWSR